MAKHGGIKSGGIPAIPQWTNQALPLYHGTVDFHVDAIMAGVDLGYPLIRANSDFGRGFYTTSSLRQAEGFALRKAQKLECAPAVIAFFVNRNQLARLDSLVFVRGRYDAVDFWSFVRFCRSGGNSHLSGNSAKQGFYDVVYGPVAALWQRRRTISGGDQASFHTNAAVGLLNQSAPQRIL
jgi:hypothetical protein